MLVRDSRNGLKVWDIIAGVANALDIDRLGLLIDQLLEFLGRVALDEFGRYSETREGDFELIVRASIQIRGAENVVACVG